MANGQEIKKSLSQTQEYICTLAQTDPTKIIMHVCTLCEEVKTVVLKKYLKPEFSCASMSNKTKCL